MNRSNVLILALSVATSLTSAISSAARVHTGTLAGTVDAPDGAPASRAHVIAQTSDGRHPHATTTDDHGRFVFKLLRTGQYDVRASLNGAWSPWKHYVIVRTGASTEILLQIAASKPAKAAPSAGAGSKPSGLGSGTRYY